ncbi:MAG: U32 family peptidase [Erysipelothrix sp.]|nr:U32 family peptidase [Erysipelothrix sp.]
MNKIELLAPAGDLERLKTAILFGADAVFIGGKQFSLRSRASNFDLATIQEAVNFAHQHNSRVHVTVNMIPHQDDLEGLDEYLIALDAIGVDAIIVASVYILKRAKALTKNFEIHISTQYSITNSKTIQFYKKLGADRVVLARENSLSELKLLKEHSSLPLEVFIHGGMCVNYSGRCTLSNYMTLRDANRGGCAQSCRWNYEIFDQKTTISDEKVLFSMSSKDLNAIDVLPDLIKMGIASLKIEGRMKTEYYIATIVSAYRRAIDDLYKGSLTSDAVVLAAKRELLNAENRETFSGFYLSQPNRSGHLYGVNGANVNQNFVAKVLNYDATTNLATLEIRNHFSKGDRLEVFGPTLKPTSFVSQKMINSDNEITHRFFKPMEVVLLEVPFVVNEGDFVRKSLL